MDLLKNFGFGKGIALHAVLLLSWAFRNDFSANGPPNRSELRCMSVGYPQKRLPFAGFGGKLGRMDRGSGWTWAADSIEMD